MRLVQCKTGLSTPRPPPPPLSNLLRSVPLFQGDASVVVYSNCAFCFKVCRQLKIFLPTPVIYATDRSKAVVPVLFLFCVALWFILRGASCFKVFPCSLFLYFVIPFSIVITSLGEERAGLCASRAFYLLCNDKSNKMTYSPSEDSDQPGQPPSLIRVLNVRTKKHWVLCYPWSA